MSEGCENCVWLKDLKEDINKLNDRVSILERSDSARDQQVKTIFNILTEIKSSIQKIADRIEVIQLKPADTADKIKLAIMTSICGGIVGFIVSKIF